MSNEAVRQDLYNAVNGEWQKTAEIPADKTSTGGFMDLVLDIEKKLMEDVERIVAGEIKLDNEYADHFITYFKQANDFEKLDEIGAEPLKPYLEELASYKSIADLDADRINVSLHYDLPFGFGVSSDLNDARINTLYFGEPGLILPDRTYYEKEELNGEALLENYVEFTKEYLVAVGYSEEEAEDLAKKTVALDKKLAKRVRSAEENADVTKMNNVRTMEEISAYLDNFDIAAVVKELVGDVDKAIVQHPEYFEDLQTLFNDENFEEIKAYMIVNFALSKSDVLSEELRQLGGKFGMLLTGQSELQNREKHAFYHAKNTFSQVIGVYYGQTYFGPEAREDVRHMVETMIDVYKERLHKNNWLQEDTINNAIKKLDKLQIMVGYPDYYPEEYQFMKVDPELSFFENNKNISDVKTKYKLEQYGKEVDHTRWGMPSDMVNAYFSPLGNLICFPAAILQEPFYSLEQGPSKNFGGIGAVIAHEISHGFDNNGANFDSFGNMVNWWTESDYEEFGKRTKAVIDQYEGLPFEDSTVNGKLTVSENIADLGGLSCALESLQREDEYSLEDFFINWARVWRKKGRKEYNQMLLASDVHAPAYWRANMVPQNLDEFHETFGTQEGDNMYLAPEKRIKIW